MSESIRRRLNAMPGIERNMQLLLQSFLDDITALQTQVNACVADIAAIRASVVATTAKLDLDATVTDTDYNTNNPAAQTGAAISALNTSE